MPTIIESLRKRGVSDEIIADAIRESGFGEYTGDVMENPFAINVQNFLNMILTDRTRFMARAKNLGIGSPQLEITNATYAATCKVNLEYFFVTLSETDRLLPEAELHTLLLKLLFEGAKTLPSEESRDEFVQLQRVLEFLA